MTRNRATPDGWHSTAELAERFQRSPEDIEALGRRHHWPRVNRDHGVLLGVNVEAVAQALGTSDIGMHGSVPPRQEIETQG